MLFVTYWELNEHMSEHERLRVADELTSSGLFPPEGVRVLRWDGTPDGWGVLIMEAESAESVHRAIGVWRAASPGFLKFTRTAPALPIQRAIGMRQEIEQVLRNGPSRSDSFCLIGERDLATAEVR